MSIHHGPAGERYIHDMEEEMKEKNHRYYLAVSTTDGKTWYGKPGTPVSKEEVAALVKSMETMLSDSNTMRLESKDGEEFARLIRVSEITSLRVHRA
jgi:hypothetical protein